MEYLINVDVWNCLWALLAFEWLLAAIIVLEVST